MRQRDEIFNMEGLAEGVAFIMKPEEREGRSLSSGGNSVPGRGTACVKAFVWRI